MKRLLRHSLLFALLLGLLAVRQQTALLVHLTLGQGVLLALVGVGATLELDADRRADQLEHASVGVFQIAHVGTRHRIHLVTVDDDQRRVGTAQVGVAQLDAAAIDQRRLVLLHRVLEDLGEAALGATIGATTGGAVGSVAKGASALKNAAVNRLGDPAQKVINKGLDLVWEPFQSKVGQLATK